MDGKVTESASEGDSGECTACCSGPSLSESELAADVRILAAAGSETRYEALRMIARSDDGVCVCELQPGLGVSQGAVSQALSRLSAAGLVTRRKEGRWRYYSATPRAKRLLDVLDETRGLEHE